MEIAMDNVITIGRRHVPLEHIAYVEPFELAEISDFKPEKPFRARVVLLDRESVLSEVTPNEFAGAHGFRMLDDDNVATNPAIKNFGSKVSSQPRGSHRPSPARLA